MNKIRNRTVELFSNMTTSSGVKVKSWVVELFDPTLASTDREIEIEKPINIRLSYKDCREPEEEQIEVFEIFEIRKENCFSNLDSSTVVHLKRLNVDGVAYYSAIDVVANSCARLLNENHKSLAMDVEIFIFTPPEFGESEEDEYEHEDEVLKMTEEDRKMIEDVLIDNRVKSVEKNREKINGICLICRDKFSVKSDNNNADDVIILKCDHVFHQNCLIPWIFENNTCPKCQYQILLPYPKKLGHEST